MASSPLRNLMRILGLQEAQAGSRSPAALLALKQDLKRGGQAEDPSGALRSLVRGQGGGQDDIVPAMLAPGEYVWDADTVAALGDGSTEEGARKLDALRERIRRHKRSAPASKIPPKAKKPEQYLKEIA